MPMTRRPQGGVRSRLRFWGPAWAVMALIFALSAVSYVPSAARAIDDGLWHGLGYGLLAALVLRGARRGALAGGHRPDRPAGRRAIAALYGVTDELHQWFVPGRAAQWSDLAADATGAAVACGALLVWRSRVVRGPADPEREGTFMNVEQILTERTGAVTTVTVNRPKVLNALSSQTVEALTAVLIDLQKDDEVRSVVLTGAGDRAFIAGADIGELAQLTPRTARALTDAGHRLCTQIERLGKPVMCRRERIRARRRMRGRDGLHLPDRREDRQAGAARDYPGHHPRVRRHPTSAASGGSGPRLRDAAHRRRRSRRKKPGESGW